MKKLLITLSLLAMSTCLFAQQSQFGIESGPNVSWLSTSKSTSPNIKYNSPVMGVNLGVVENFNFGHVAVHTGIDFIDEGGRFNEDGVFKTLRIFYLEAPVDLIYQQHKGKKGFFFGGGPFAGLGLGGGLNLHPAKRSQPQDLFLLKKGAPYKAGNFGYEGIAGYKLESGFEFNINYDQGITNITTAKTNPNGDRVLNTRMVEFTLGYFF